MGWWLAGKLSYDTERCTFYILTPAKPEPLVDLLMPLVGKHVSVIASDKSICLGVLDMAPPCDRSELT